MAGDQVLHRRLSQVKGLEISRSNNNSRLYLKYLSRRGVVVQVDRKPLREYGSLSQTSILFSANHALTLPLIF